MRLEPSGAQQSKDPSSLRSRKRKVHKTRQDSMVPFEHRNADEQ